MNVMAPKSWIQIQEKHWGSYAEKNDNALIDQGKTLKILNYFPFIQVTGLTGNESNEQNERIIFFKKVCMLSQFFQFWLNSATDWYMFKLLSFNFIVFAELLLAK